MVFTASLLGAQHIKDSVENKLASLLVVSLGKALNGMPPSLCGRQMVGPSSLPVVVAQSDERPANRAWARTREWMNKMGRPVDSPASFRPISLTSCVLQLFERIILSHLLFFLKSNSILSPRQVSFRPGRSTLDQILFLAQSISDGFNKLRPGSRTILATIDFSTAFDSLWHPGLFRKLISVGLPSCFARWT